MVEVADDTAHLSDLRLEWIGTHAFGSTIEVADLGSVGSEQKRYEHNLT